MTTCRFCNGLIEPGGRCQRCDLETSAGSVPTTVAARNRATLRLVVLSMVGIALFTAVFALATTSFRRANDRPKDKAESSESAATGKPADWPALVLVPNNCDFLIGLNVAQLLRAPEGRRLLKMTDLDSLLSTSVAEIDHLVVALTIKALPPQFMIVGQTTKPITVQKLLGTSTVANKVRRHGRDLWLQTVEFQGMRIEVAAHLDGQNFAIALPADFEHWSPGESAKTPQAWRSLLVDRVEPVSMAWIVGTSMEREPLPALLEQLQVRGHWNWLRKLRQVAIGARLVNEQAQFRAAFQFVSGADLPKLENEINEAMDLLLAGPLKYEEASDGWLSAEGRLKPVR